MRYVQRSAERKGRTVVLDETFNVGPYLEDAFRSLGSSDRERDKRDLLEIMGKECSAWYLEGNEKAETIGKSSFLLWNIVSGKDERTLAPLVNDLPGIILVNSFHDLFRKHIDENTDLAVHIRYEWHRTLFILYKMMYEESGDPLKGFRMLTQAFAMGEIHVSLGNWDEARSALEDMLNFGEDLSLETDLPDDIWMLLGVSAFYLSIVMEKTEKDPNAEKEWMREALEKFSHISEDFHPNVTEISAICREKLGA